MKINYLQSLSSRAGWAAVAVFWAIVIAGMAVVSGFSPVDLLISYLYARGARYGGLFRAGFIVYNILLAAFGAALFARARSAGGKTLAGRMMAVALMIEAVAGVVDDCTPPDAPGMPLSAIGLLHWGSTFFAFVIILAALAFSIAWFSSRRGAGTLAAHSAIVLAVTAVCGALSCAATTLHWPVAGIYQVILMAAFHSWIVLVSVDLVRDKGVLTVGAGPTQTVKQDKYR